MNVSEYCVCCLKEHYGQDVYHFNGEQIGENYLNSYADMLLNTFNIKITNIRNNKICKECITKLCDATSFKEQILNAQDNIKELMNRNVLELKIAKDGYDIDNKGSDFSDNEFNWVIKSDTNKGPVFIIKPESKNAENITSKIVGKCIKNLRNTARVNKCIKKIKIKKIPEAINLSTKAKNAMKKTNGKTKNGESDLECHPITQTELNSRSNTLRLIQNSNLCLFRSLKTRFGCFLCKTSFVDVSKLREHYLTHKNTSIIASKINKCRGLSFKNAEISQLKCNLCFEDIMDLTQLMSHLKNNHDIIFSGAKHFLIPYKLLENYQCVLCEMKYKSFLRLSIHMNSHYKNNVCEICGLPFINRISLRTHVQSMHKEKKCSHCPAKFFTVTAKVKHLKKVHNYFNSKRYCNLCDKTFRYTYLLHNHKIEEHGVKKTIVNCSDCGKTFYSDANLKIHIRSVHIKERNYQCEICGTRFFTKCDQKRHERTHNNLRSFACSYCDTKFKSKDSCRRHMKRQHSHVFQK